MKKKSKSLNVRGAFKKIERFADTVFDDRVTVYAAQASFFIVISSIPFIMLLISIAGSFIPERVADILSSMGDNLPEKLKDLYLGIIAELNARPAVNLISVTAITAFWMASRGISSVRGGISTVYKSHPDEGVLKSFLFSAIYTAVFLLLLVVIILAQLFGEQLYWALTTAFPGIRGIVDFAFKFKLPALFVMLTLFFALLYFAVNRKGAFVSRKFRSHLPGAIVAAAGWLLFSYFYSLYTTFFTGVSYIYGSLTAIILLLLWIYVCMIILLIGAEINKALATRKTEKTEAEGSTEA